MKRLRKYSVLYEQKIKNHFSLHFLKSCTMKKKESTAEPHFKPLVETYFNFCEENFGTKPSFDGAIPRDFKNLIAALRKRSEESNFEWTEYCASETLRYFLEVAITDQWICKNFLVRVLFTQKDKIFFKIASNGNNKTSTGYSNAGNPRSEQRISGLKQWGTTR